MKNRKIKYNIKCLKKYITNHNDFLLKEIKEQSDYTMFIIHSKKDDFFEFSIVFFPIENLFHISTYVAKKVPNEKIVGSVLASNGINAKIFSNTRCQISLMGEDEYYLNFYTNAYDIGVTKKSFSAEKLDFL